MTLLTVMTVPAFADNYIWLIHDGAQAVVVDPGNAEPVIVALAKHGLTLVAILLTHHHADHVGGVARLLAQRAVPVYGPAREAIFGVTDQLSESDQVTITELDLTLSVIDVPGHTRGHIAYFATPPQQPGWLFCGDTLFAGGCGRLFEGSPAQMLNSLNKLASLPDPTLVFCAHEYTLANLRFALQVDAANPALQTRMQTEQARRAQQLPTVPSTIQLERATNPFLRVGEIAILQALQHANRLHQVDDLSAFTALREWKNSFR